MKALLKSMYRWKQGGECGAEAWRWRMWSKVWCPGRAPNCDSWSRWCFKVRLERKSRMWDAISL